MDEARLSPLWEVIVISAKGFFDALANAALLVVLLIGLDRYHLEGLGPIIIAGLLLLVAMLGARCWQVAEGLRPRIGAWASLVFAGMLTVMLLPVLGGLAAGTQELLAKR